MLHCLPARLPVCLSIRLPLGPVPAGLPTTLPACLPPSLPVTWMPVAILACLQGFKQILSVSGRASKQILSGPPRGGGGVGAPCGGAGGRAPLPLASLARQHACTLNGVRKCFSNHVCGLPQSASLMLDTCAWR